MSIIDYQTVKHDHFLDFHLSLKMPSHTFMWGTKVSFIFLETHNSQSPSNSNLFIQRTNTRVPTWASRSDSTMPHHTSLISIIIIIPSNLYVSLSSELLKLQNSDYNYVHTSHILRACCMFRCKFMPANVNEFPDIFKENTLRRQWNITCLPRRWHGLKETPTTLKIAARTRCCWRLQKMHVCTM